MLQKQVEEYVAYVAAHELDSLINENFDTSHEARVMKGHISIILQICIDEFSDNAYVINYNKRNLAAIEGTKILEEEHVVQPKLGDLWEPLENDNKSQTQNSSVPCVSCEEIER